MSGSHQATESTAIPGITQAREQQLLQVLARHPHVKAVWLFGSRAMGRHQQGSDIDLCLEGAKLSHSDRLQLMAAVDNLLMPWRVDLVLRHQLPAELEAHLQRVGRCIWTK